MPKNSESRHNEWDLESATLSSSPPKGGRVVVSLSLQKAEFDRLSMEAERLGMRVSSYIKKAVLETHAVETTIQPAIFGTDTAPSALMLTGVTDLALGNTKAADNRAEENSASLT